jgi:outer membrane immunogenic protein
MRKLIVCATLITLHAGSSALAADMPVKAPPPVAPAAYYHSWSGFYVGAHVGYGWGHFGFRDPYVKLDQPIFFLPGLFVGVPLERDFKGSGFLGGLQAGVNAQFGSIVVGVEGDASWMDIDGEFRSTSGIPQLLTTSEGVSANLKWLATLRGRVGVALDRFLVYGTGGVAFGGVDAAGDITVTLSNPGALALPSPATLSLAASERRTHIGWTAGGGVEGMITSNISAKLEYLYADLGWLKHEGPATIGGTLAPLLPAGISLKGGGDFKVTVHTIKLGINYRFGDPVVARD